MNHSSLGNIIIGTPPHLVRLPVRGYTLCHLSHHNVHTMGYCLVTIFMVGLLWNQNEGSRRSRRSILSSQVQELRGRGDGEGGEMGREGVRVIEWMGSSHPGKETFMSHMLVGF